MWGRSASLDVALGIWTKGAGVRLHNNDTTEPRTTIVWIYHNGINHYKGLCNKTKYSTAKKGSQGYNKADQQHKGYTVENSEGQKQRGMAKAVTWEDLTDANQDHS